MKFLDTRFTRTHFRFYGIRLGMLRIVRSCQTPGLSGWFPIQSHLVEAGEQLCCKWMKSEETIPFDSQHFYKRWRAKELWRNIPFLASNKTLSGVEWRQCILLVAKWDQMGMQERIESLHVMYASWDGIVMAKSIMSGKHTLAHRGRQIRANMAWNIPCLSVLGLWLLNTGSI